MANIREQEQWTDDAAEAYMKEFMAAWAWQDGEYEAADIRSAFKKGFDAGRAFEMRRSQSKPGEPK